MSFDIYGAERTGGAQVFAGSAADTFFLVNDRQLRRIRVVRVFCHHQDRLGRAVAGTVAASDAIRLTMQFSWINTACPIWIAVLSAFVIGRIAPVGQTSEHLTHSGRQYPRSYDTSGCMNVCRFPEGRSTWFVQTDTQSWHAVQCWEKLAALSEPGGVTGVARSGFFLSSMMANPPSTFLSGSCTFPGLSVRQKWQVMPIR